MRKPATKGRGLEKWTDWGIHGKGKRSTVGRFSTKGRWARPLYGRKIPEVRRTLPSAIRFPRSDLSGSNHPEYVAAHDAVNENRKESTATCREVAEFFATSATFSGRDPPESPL